MSQESVEKFLGRLLTDDFFRFRASNHLESACHEEGYSLSQEELSMIRLLDLPSFSGLSGILDSGIKRFSPFEAGGSKA